MGRKTRLLTDDVVVLAKSGLEQIGKTGAVAIKLKIILAAHEHGITTVCKIMGVTKTTVISWIKAVGTGTFESLELKPGRGRKPTLTSQQEAQIQKWIEDDPQLTIQHIKERILDTMNIKLARSTVHRIMQNLKFAYITPRPQHHKKPVTSDQEAKKKSGKPD